MKARHRLSVRAFVATVCVVLTMVLALLLPGSAMSANQPSGSQPEKSQLRVTIAAWSVLYVPLFVAQDAGYFSKHGIDVSIARVSASASVQALASGTVDMYQGGGTPIAANLAGFDVIYLAAAVDRSTLTLFGQKGLTSFESLKGKTVAVTSPGAFGEIAIRNSAKKYGLEIGKDIKLLYHPHEREALATFLVGNAAGVMVTPPQSDMAAEKGYPVIVDYYNLGLKITGPGMAVTREFFRKYPNTLKAYLRGYLDGVKRSFDDKEYAMRVEEKYAKISDPKQLEQHYQLGLKVWNKDITVDPASIQVMLEGSANPKAKGVNRKELFDNSLIEEVNREYASKLFPGEVR